MRPPLSSRPELPARQHHAPWLLFSPATSSLTHFGTQPRYIGAMPKHRRSRLLISRQMTRVWSHTGTIACPWSSEAQVQHSCCVVMQQFGASGGCGLGKLAVAFGCWRVCATHHGADTLQVLKEVGHSHDNYFDEHSLQVRSL